MSRVTIRPVEDLQWQRGGADEPQERRDTGWCVHHPGAEETPQLFELEMQPNQFVEPHAHEHDEVIYVMRGEMHLGDRVLKPGSSVSIPAYAVYSFRAGSEGLHFLNFRTCLDSGTLTPAEAIARRGSRA